MSSGASGVLGVVCLVGAALVVVVPSRRPRPVHRLARLPIGPGPDGRPHPDSRPHPERRPLPDGRSGPGGAPGPDGPPAGGQRSARLRALRRPDPRRCAAGLTGIAVVLLLGGWLGVLAGAGVAVALDRGLRRLPSTARRAQRLAGASELPLAADLLAVALRGGAPVDRATAAVAEALPGPLGDRLARVGRVLRLGGTPAEAWDQLAPVDGAARLVRAAVRSAEHGSALAGALVRLADDLRADRTVATDAAARRAGVLIVLPLGLCFLPAFILAGLVPVIVAILGDVL